MNIYIYIILYILYMSLAWCLTSWNSHLRPSQVPLDVSASRRKKHRKQINIHASFHIGSTTGKMKCVNNRPLTLTYNHKIPISLHAGQNFHMFSTVLFWAPASRLSEETCDAQEHQQFAPASISPSEQRGAFRQGDRGWWGCLGRMPSPIYVKLNDAHRQGQMSRHVQC